MLKPEMIKYIEENIDLESNELLQNVKERFKLECDTDEVSCICKAVERTIDLYKNYDQETVSQDMHQRLMDRLKNSCK